MQVTGDSMRETEAAREGPVLQQRKPVFDDVAARAQRATEQVQARANAAAQRASQEVQGTIEALPTTGEMLRGARNIFMKPSVNAPVWWARVSSVCGLVAFSLLALSFADSIAMRSVSVPVTPLWIVALSFNILGSLCLTLGDHLVMYHEYKRGDAIPRAQKIKAAVDYIVVAGWITFLVGSSIALGKAVLDQKLLVTRFIPTGSSIASAVLWTVGSSLLLLSKVGQLSGDAFAVANIGAMPPRWQAKTKLSFLGSICKLAAASFFLSYCMVFVWHTTNSLSVINVLGLLSCVLWMLGGAFKFSSELQ